MNGIYARRFGGLVPTALAVDVQATPSSNGNRVFESGELVVASPSWRNVNGATLAFDGAASAFTGPTGPAYTIVDNGAGYGSVPNNTIGYCGNVANCYALRITAGARPAAHWDAQFREDIVPVALGQSKVWSLHVGDTFTDVPRTDPFYRFIETVLHRGVMTGCTAEPVLSVLRTCPATRWRCSCSSPRTRRCRRPALRARKCSPTSRRRARTAGGSKSWCAGVSWPDAAAATTARLRE